ncbi:hypothetical protein AVEN_88483-1 [Araneus ventricosus]|uniref:Uncharacterized protein n=1 Tax=Araneus ventricosus TaxID=182803 RepID=A0A4Y2TSJ9_ARAVE|nr:hypothetical protein AVEN_88483-1 [Araneus ventricosus]
MILTRRTRFPLHDWVLAAARFPISPQFSPPDAAVSRPQFSAPDCFPVSADKFSLEDAFPIPAITSSLPDRVSFLQTTTVHCCPDAFSPFLRPQFSRRTRFRFLRAVLADAFSPFHRPQFAADRFPFLRSRSLSPARFPIHRCNRCVSIPAIAGSQKPDVSPFHQTRNLSCAHGPIPCDPDLSCVFPVPADHEISLRTFRFLRPGSHFTFPVSRSRFLDISRSLTTHRLSFHTFPDLLR